MLVDVDLSALVVQFLESVVVQAKGLKRQNVQGRIQANLERLCGHERGCSESSA